MPDQEGIRHDELAHLAEEFPAERFALPRKPSSLVIRQRVSPTAVQVFEDAVFLEEVVDYLLLIPVDLVGTNELKEVDLDCQGVIARRPFCG